MLSLITNHYFATYYSSAVFIGAEVHRSCLRLCYRTAKDTIECCHGDKNLFLSPLPNLLSPQACVLSSLFLSCSLNASCCLPLRFPFFFSLSHSAPSYCANVNGLLGQSFFVFIFLSPSVPILPLVSLPLSPLSRPRGPHLLSSH